MTDKRYILIGGPYDAHEVTLPSTEAKLVISEPVPMAPNTRGLKMVHHEYFALPELPGVMVFAKLSKAEAVERLVCAYVQAAQARNG